MDAAETSGPTDTLVDAGALGASAAASTSRTPAPTAAASSSGVVGAVASSPPVTTTLRSEAAATTRGARIAIAWVDEDAVARSTTAAQTLDGAASPYVPVGAELLAYPPRRSPWRAGVLGPIAIFILVIALYSATTLLWPLHAVAPTVEAAQVDPDPAPPAALTWPASGSASMSVAGMDGVVASAGETVAIASITKVVTALLVLDQMPLAVGEQGPEFRFTEEDAYAYWELSRERRVGARRARRRDAHAVSADGRDAHRVGEQLCRPSRRQPVADGCGLRPGRRCVAERPRHPRRHGRGAHGARPAERREPGGAHRPREAGDGRSGDRRDRRQARRGTPRRGARHQHERPPRRPRGDRDQDRLARHVQPALGEGHRRRGDDRAHLRVGPRPAR